MNIGRESLVLANRFMEHVFGCTCPLCRELGDDIQAAIEDWQAAQVEATQ